MAARAAKHRHRDDTCGPIIKGLSATKAIKQHLRCNAVDSLSIQCDRYGKGKRCTQAREEAISQGLTRGDPGHKAILRIAQTEFDNCALEIAGAHASDAHASAHKICTPYSYEDSATGEDVLMGYYPEDQQDTDYQPMDIDEPEKYEDMDMDMDMSAGGNKRKCKGKTLTGEHCRNNIKQRSRTGKCHLHR